MILSETLMNNFSNNILAEEGGIPLKGKTSAKVITHKDTDGLISGITMVHALEKRGIPRDRITIQFAQYGDDDKSYEKFLSKNDSEYVSVTDFAKFPKVKVYDENGAPLITMNYKKIDYNPTFKKNYFSIDKVVESTNQEEKVKQVASIDDNIFPLALPAGTKLANQEKVSKTNGERVILTFEGEKPFLLVEETANVFDEFTIIPTTGDPYILQDTVGVMGNNSLNWTTGGIEYYIVSDVLNQNELVEIASSINTLPTMK